MTPRCSRYIVTAVAIAAAVMLGCGSRGVVPPGTVQSPLEAPSVWLDLPDSPFAVSHLGPQAVLVNRTGESISKISVGCVTESNGLVTVVAALWITDLTHGGWTHEYPARGILEEIARLYRAPELFGPGPTPRRCPAGSNPAITEAGSRGGFNWSAERTLWPKGPPHDTRNTWKVSSRTPPSFEYVNLGGCGDADVYAANSATTEVLWVQVDLNRKKLPTARRPLVVNLANLAQAEKVEIHVYQTDRHDWFCSDVSRWDSEAPTVWLPRRGTLTVWAEPRGRDFADYPVTVQIHGADFAGPDGATIRPPRPIEIKTRAGGMVGG